MVNTVGMDQLSRLISRLNHPPTLPVFAVIRKRSPIAQTIGRMSTTNPNLPALNPSTSYSFYPYPLRSIPTTSLRGLAPPPQSQAQAGPSTTRRAEIQKATHVRERAERRALIGLRPAGFAIGRESEDLDLEEITQEDERVSLDTRSSGSALMEQEQIRSFGHRFLLPIGRRQTQMEIDAAPVGSLSGTSRQS
jgi:hypothetical protein